MANVSENPGVTSSNAVVASSTEASVPLLVAGTLSLLDDPFIPEVIGLCRTVFPGEVTVESMVDPSEPDDPWLSFNVTAHGKFAEILKRESEWHELVERLTGSRAGKYRLSVYPVE